jgi:hypothetical protein
MPASVWPGIVHSTVYVPARSRLKVPASLSRASACRWIQSPLPSGGRRDDERVVGQPLVRELDADRSRRLIHSREGPATA